MSIAARLRRSDPWAKDSTCRVRCRRCRCPAKSLLARMAVGSRDSLQQQSLSNTASARTTMSIRTWPPTKVADASNKMELRASITSLWTSLTNSWKVRTHTCSTTSRRGLMRLTIATSSFNRSPSKTWRISPRGMSTRIEPCSKMTSHLWSAMLRDSMDHWTRSRRLLASCN